ncbi:hypothetical protein FEE96_16395 [Parasedimentitalea maritima]|uniref:Uncharacterized protein n=1 Tax=Parasedimentitalea maritima TaxID=2578117 RepID=A0ABY2USC3_9RHOB|nr:hypothetical protein [Zongyanglinia marina]TLP60435.1 hypothetical protein FEE96_16395 [Zongyanglinia marina]
MRYKALYFAILMTASCTEVAQAPIISSDNTQLLLVEPVQLWRDRLGNCVSTERCWSELSQEQIRDELSLFEAKTVINKVNQDGSLSYLTGKASAEAGKYRVTQYAMVYTNQPCGSDDEPGGVRRVGAGVRVTANITTNKKNINLGALIPLAVAANRSWARGEIQINSWGISSSDNAVSTYLNVGGLALNEAGIQKAIESMAVARVLLNDDDTKISPWTLAVREIEPGSCLD